MSIASRLRRYAWALRALQITLRVMPLSRLDNFRSTLRVSLGVTLAAIAARRGVFLAAPAARSVTPVLVAYYSPTPVLHLSVLGVGGVRVAPIGIARPIRLLKKI